MSQPSASLQSKPQTEHGIAALEFAIVFPVFFLVLYGILTYGMIFVAQQSLTLAAAEGARHALRDAGGACTAATYAASWLGEDVSCTSSGKVACAYDASQQCLQVTVTYPYRDKPLIPLLLGPLMNVAVPDALGSSSTVQLEE